MTRYLFTILILTSAAPAFADLEQEYKSIHVAVAEARREKADLKRAQAVSALVERGYKALPNNWYVRTFCPEGATPEGCKGNYYEVQVALYPVPGQIWVIPATYIKGEFDRGAIVRSSLQELARDTERQEAAGAALLAHLIAHPKTSLYITPGPDEPRRLESWEDPEMICGTLPDGGLSCSARNPRPSGYPPAY